MDTLLHQSHMLKSGFLSVAMIATMIVLGSCNKDRTTVELPPFSIFPNPCQEVCQVYLDPPVPAPGSATVYRPNGEELTRFTLMPGQVIQLQLPDEGVHVLEVILDGESFYGQIINQKP